MIRTFVLLFLILNFTHAEMVGCDYQEQFILGNQNLFVEEMAIEICSKPEYQEDPENYVIVPRKIKRLLAHLLKIYQ